jgi:hypothetical protein
VGSAWLQDLVGVGLSSVAARRASLALTTGFCLGPLSAGLLGEFGPRPLVLPYLVHAVTVALLLVVAVTIARHGAWGSGLRGVAGASLLPRTELDADARRVFRRTLVPTAICVYAFPSVAVAVLPLSLGHLQHAVAFAGVLAAVSLGSGAVVQPFGQRLGARRGTVGAALGAVGFGLGIVAAAAPSMPFAFAAGALLGAGGGLCLNAGLVLVQQLSTHATRGACNGLFYTWAYLGFAAPLLTTSFVPVGDLAVPLAVLCALTAATAGWLAFSPVPFQGGVAGG